MRAVTVKPGHKDSARLTEMPMPKPEAGEVRVRVLEVGIDGTDIDINSGHYGEAPPGEESLTIGHEAVGIVDGLGDEVTSIEVGDLVVPTVRRGCREACPGCRHLEPDMCLTGNYEERGILRLHGYMSEYFTERPEYLLKLPQELRDIGIFVEPLSVCVKAIDQALRIQERLRWSPQTALVLGAGNIGLLSTLLLCNMNVTTYTLDIAPRDSLKARLVGLPGASYIDGRQMPVLEFPRRIGEPDIIIEATGYSKNAFDAMQVVRNDGIVCLLSVTAGENLEEICTNCIDEKLVMGNRAAFGSVSSNRGHFQEAIERMVEIEEKWPGVFDKMITRRVLIAGFKVGLEKTPEDIKSVVVMAA